MARSKSELVLRVDHTLIREIMDKDPEFYVEVKKGIIRSALQNHLFKALDVMTEAQLAKAVKAEVGDYVYGSYNRKLSINLNPQFARAVDNTINGFIDKTKEDILKNILESFDEAKLEEKIKESIDSYLESKIDKLIEAKLKEKIKKVLG